jgi:ribosomal protein L7Ae-like RNA K-turn-binding protein
LQSNREWISNKLINKKKAKFVLLADDCGEEAIKSLVIALSK